MKFFFPCLGRVVALGALFLAGRDLRLAAQSDKGPDHDLKLPKFEDPIIELPKYIVKDSRELPPPEKWRYAEIPGFEILSNASDRDTQKLLADFELFNIAIDIVWKGIQQKRTVPISLIICGKDAKFDVFVPGEENQPDSGRASLFLKNQEQAAIILDYQARTINLSSIQNADAAAAAGSADTDPSKTGDFEVDAYKQLYREYLYYLMSRADPRMPAWLEEGLAQLFMGMKVDRKSITFARVADPNEKSINGANEDDDFNKALQKNALMPLDQFFAVDHDSPIALNPLGSRWAKQAQGLVHLWLYGENQKYQKAFVTFVLRLQKEPVSEALFKECFKKSYKEMLLEFRGYTSFTAYKSFDFVAKKGSPGIPQPKPLELRDATQSEVGRIKGDALRLGGHFDSAHAALIAPYIRGERDPRLLAALGLEERAENHDDRAMIFLEAATKAKVGRPRAYLELARLRYEAALAKPTDADGKLGSDQVVSILEPLFIARRQPPAMPELYQLIAETWAHSAAPPRPEHFQVVLQGVRQFPRNLDLIFDAALLASQRGFLPDALALVNRGRKLAVEESDVSRFEVLQSALQRDAEKVAPSAALPEAPAPATTTP